MAKVVLLHPEDNVLTSLAALAPGDVVTVETSGGPMRLTLRDAVPYAHKIACRAMAPGEAVVKYGEVIGVASTAIAPGDWVHVHNVESARARGDKMRGPA